MICHILIYMVSKVFDLGDVSGLDRVLPHPRSCGTDCVSTTAYRYRGSERRRDSGLQVFQYTLSGSGCISIKGVTHAVPEGSGFLCGLYDPDVVYFYPPEADEAWRFIYLTFRNGGDWVRGVNAAGGHVHRIPRDGLFVPELLRFCRMRGTSLPLRLDAGFDLVNRLFIEISRGLTAGASRTRARGLLRKAIEAMREQVESPEGIAEIAARVGVTTAHLCRVFRKELDTSPLAYFQRQKLRHAAALLREGKLPIKEIAHRIGIGNVANFTRLFKRHMGLPPGRFRDAIEPDVEPIGKA